MDASNIFAVAVSLATILVSASAQNVTGHLHLDNNYMVDYVLYNATGNVRSIEFTVNVTTIGWIGIGINNASLMAGADIFIGGRNESTNRNYNGDYHVTTGHGPPALDAIQNWNMTTITQAYNWTVFKVVRKLDTADANQDVKIENKAQYVIWAYGENDNITWHGSVTRGSQGINFLSTGASAGTFSSAIVALAVGLFASITRH